VTIQEAAQTALDVQDACNLSGVLASFHEIVSNVIWPEARRLGQGTDFVNRHPICTLFLVKLTDLNGYSDSITDGSFSNPCAEVSRLAEASGVQK
jgi:hypothetical protein